MKFDLFKSGLSRLRIRSSIMGTHLTGSMLVLLSLGDLQILASFSRFGDWDPSLTKWGE